MTTTANVMRNEVTLSYGKVRYLEAGTGAPAVLLHGVAAAGGADDWRPSMAVLSKSFRVLAPDMLTWPPSDTREGVDAFPNLTDFVREFQDGLGLSKSHVIGATMGGWIAGLFAYESPSRVDKLVLTGNPGFHGSRADRLAEWQIPPDETVHDQLMRMMDGVPEAEAAALVQEKITKLHEEGFGEAFQGTMKTMSNPDNRIRYNLMRRLPVTPVPMLFVLGRGDPSSEIADQLQAAAPTAKVHIVEEGAHQVHYENVEEFCRVVTEFLS